MALVNPNIAMSYRGVEMPQQNALADYAAIQQIQGGRQAQELNALKMQEAQAAMQERNALRQLNPAAADYESQLFKVSPQLGIQYRKEAATSAAQKAAQAKSEFDLKAAQRKFGDDLKRSLSSNPSDANIIAFGEDAVLQGLYTPDQVKATVSQLLSIPVADRTRILSQAGATAGELRPVAVGSSLMTPQGQLLATAPRPPQLLTPEEEAQKARIAQAGRAPAAPRPEQPPVAVVDPVTGKSVFVSREQAISGKMAPAAAQESLSPKEIQKREAALPQATSAVTGFEKKTDSFVKDLTELRNHPGLSEITGFAAGRLPGITAAGRAAQALYDKVVAKGGFQALQDLRDASKTGGALGNVSNQEGKQLTASFSAIDRKQDAADVQAALDTAIADVQGARTRMREAYDMTYSYKGGEAPTPRSPGAAPTAPNIDALLNKYK